MSVFLRAKICKDLTDSIVQLYEIFVKRYAFQRKDLLDTISLVSPKGHLLLGMVWYGMSKVYVVVSILDTTNYTCDQG